MLTQLGATSRDGIIFNEKQDIILADQFAEVNVLIPFPQQPKKIHEDLELVTTKLEILRENRNQGCAFMANANTTLQSKSLKWLMTKTNTEITNAQLDHNQFITDITNLFPKRDTIIYRQRRSFAVLGVVTGAVGLGIGIGSTFKCGIKGVFGSCPSWDEQNRDNIEELIENINNITTTIHEVQMENDNKMFLISDQLLQLHKSQEAIITAQNENWRIIHHEVEILRNRTHTNYDCEQSLFMRQEVMYTRMLIADILTTMMRDLRTYRMIILQQKNVIMTSLTSMRMKFIPFSLLQPKELHKILDTVANDPQYRVEQRLTLAIPREQIMTYYESKILTTVTVDPLGLVFTLAIPLATGETSMTVYEAIIIPMPQNDSAKALVWDIEEKFIAISENRNELAVMTQKQLNSCVGSSTTAICYEAIATEVHPQSCIATLFIEGARDALRVCKVKTVTLPLVERAQNIKQGRWLITARSPNFAFKQMPIGENNPQLATYHAGCRSCVISLPCGYTLEGPHVRLRPDLQVCTTEPSLRITTQLTTELESLFELVQTLDEMPQFNDISTARMALVDEVQRELVLLPVAPVDIDDLRKIAEPAARAFKKLHPHYTAELTQDTSWQTIVLFVFVTLTLAGYVLLCCLIGIPRLRRKYEQYRDGEPVRAPPVFQPLQPLGRLQLHEDEIRPIHMYPMMEVPPRLPRRRSAGALDSSYAEMTV